MLSLKARLGMGAGVVLAVFLGATGYALDRAFHQSQETALRARLEAELYALLADAEPDAAGIPRLPPMLPEPRFNRPHSGLYGFVEQQGLGIVWRSGSSVGLTLRPDPAPQLGHHRFTQVARLLRLSWAVSFDEGPSPKVFVFHVYEDLTAFDTEAAQFRQTLWLWLGGAAFLLLAVLYAILQAALSPLNRAARDLAAVEAGTARALAGSYPKELEGLVHAINALHENAREHLARYRDALGNLAHSLKTPLAVMRTSLPDHGAWRHQADEQLQKINDLVDYHLRRAAAAGRQSLGAATSVAPIMREVLSALKKVHADRVLDWEASVAEDAQFRGDAGDLTEILGNLLDNAAKWARREIRLDIRQDHGLLIRVGDDGPGIPDDQVARVLARGGRADPATPGHGIGLDVVSDLVRFHGGTLTIGRGPQGGAELTVRLP